MLFLWVIKQEKSREDSVDRNVDFRLAKISFQISPQQQTFNPLTQIFPTPPILKSNLNSKPCPSKISLSKEPKSTTSRTLT